MPTDATGTPTPNVQIPTFQTNQDKPSGVGSNNQMTFIDGLLSGAYSLKTLAWGPTGGGATVDTNLYRSAAASLKTDGQLRVGGRIIAAEGAANQVLIGDSIAGLYFGSATDTNLYRAGADVLQTQDQFVIQQPGDLSTNYALTVTTQAGNSWFTLRGDQKMVFVDSSTGGQDTLLSRAAAGVVFLQNALTTPGVYTAGSGVKVGLFAGGYGNYGGLALQGNNNNFANASIFHNAYYDGTTTDGTLRWNATHPSFGSRGIVFDYGVGIRFFADTTATTGGSAATITERFKIDNSGNVYMDMAGNGAGLYFGNGADVNIARQGSNSVRTNSAWNVVLPLTSINPFLYYVGSETNPRWYVEGGTGKIYWGAGGGSAVDTNLYRYAADWLATDDVLLANGQGIVSWGGSEANWGFYMKVSTDANYRHMVNLGGTHVWGPGTTAYDTNLYRASAGRLKTDGGFDSGVLGTSSTGGAFRATGLQSTASYPFVAIVSGEANERFNIAIAPTTGNPTLNFGPGGVTAPDTNLYRNGVNILKTDGSFYAAYHSAAVTSVGNTAFQSVLNSEANEKWKVNGDGQTWWGAGGASTVDTNLYRSGVNNLKTDGYFTIAVNSTTALNFSGAGAGLTIGGDTNLYRNAASTLKTDGNLVVAGNLTVSGTYPSTNALISHTQITTNVTGITGTTEGTATTVLTAGAFTPDGTSSYVFEFFSPNVQSNTGGQFVTLFLHDGSAAVGLLCRWYEPSGSSANGGPMIGRFRYVPTATSKTYSVRAYVSGGSGSVTAGAGGSGAYVPASLRILKD